MMDKKWFDDMDAKIPRNGVRTRFAPSPTGYMHVGGLRTALYAYLIAKKVGGTFILRIEDTDTTRFVEGATEIIIDTLLGAGLRYDEGPDIGGPVAPYTQSERRELYRPYAELLCEKGAAYYCFCEHVSHDERDHSQEGVVSLDADICRAIPYDEALNRVKRGDPHVIRMKTPTEGVTEFDDMVFGNITVQNKTLDDMILLKRDGLPTYNFANVIDDHLMGITHVLRGSEYISSAPKYNILYKAFDWDIPAYITVSLIMRDAQNKLSKRKGDPTYDDLLKQGFLPDAILNYVALLGWSPGGEREIFMLDELPDVFSIDGISKSPAIFDIDKLTYFNGEYIRAMSPEQFAGVARPYILSAVKSEGCSSDAISAILQARCEKLGDIPSMIDFFDELPEYETQLFIHKKSKTDEAISLEMLRAVYPAMAKLNNWTADEVHASLINLAEELGVKNATVMWPLRIAVSGKAVTPGGAVEICVILGRGETLNRINAGIAKLGGNTLE